MLRQLIVFGGVFTLAGAVIFWTSSREETTAAGFWFEPITEETTRTLPERFGEGLTAGELQQVEAVAFAEIAHAFQDLPVAVSRDREARYRVRVVDSLRHPMSPKMPAPSGESRAIPGVGGQGAVNFRLIAHSAVAFAPAEAGRDEMVAAIGRGIGRAAVHEFAHQFLGGAPIHDSRDVRSYEYRSAAREAQYYGEMHWDIAAPLLRKRFRVDER